MNDLQKAQFEILKAFIQVCEKHHLTYYLNSGTCLGAVRHKGFIPWDDDIDVCLPREDYEKFLKLQYEFDGTPFFIQTFETDPKYTYNFAKVRNSNTTCIESFYKFNQQNHGVWIDVFPLDGFSKEVKEPIKFKRKVKRIWWNVYLCYPWGVRRKIRLKHFFKDLVLDLFALLFFWGNVGHYRNKMLEKRMKKIPFSESKMAGVWHEIMVSKAAMPTEIFGKGSVGEFEGLKVMLPEDVDKYLTLLYGDYMTPPPEGKREGHHGMSGVSMTIGYKEYMKDKF